MGLSTLGRNASFRVGGCHGINNFIIWYDIHIKIITKLYSPGERCSQRRWWSLTSSVTPTYLFFLHSVCVPDQIGLSLSRERAVSGRNLSRRGKWTKSEQTNILLRLFAVVNCWFLVILIILHRCDSLDRNCYSLSYRHALQILNVNAIGNDRNWDTTNVAVTETVQCLPSLLIVSLVV